MLFIYPLQMVQFHINIFLLLLLISYGLPSLRQIDYNDNLSFKFLFLYPTISLIVIQFQAYA
jgi:hypothetical protein